MAQLKFFIKPITVKSSPNQSVYVRYRPNRNFDLVIATPFKILIENWSKETESWDADQVVKGARTTESKLKNNEIEKFNENIFKLKSNLSGFIDTHLNLDADTLKNEIKEFFQLNYFANRIKKETGTNKIPNNFSALIDFYIEQRSVLDKTKNTKPISQNTIKKYITIKNILKDFDKNLLATEINNIWRNKFVEYMNKLKYSENTQIKNIKNIKMFCAFANADNEISKQVLNWEINANPKNVSEVLTLSFSQLTDFKNAIMPSEKLNNTRDWFLISCYTSVRISELMNMKSENIQQHGEDYFIQVYEPKTGNTKIIYLLPEVVTILNKRNGDFPKSISDQKYNEYLKEVAEIAGLTEITEGGIRENGRKTIKKLPQYKFISSHTGRATYVTLFKDKLPTEIIQMQTNHHSEKMVEHYDKTTDLEKRMRTAKLVAQAHRGLDDFHEVKLKVV